MSRVTLTGHIIVPEADLEFVKAELDTHIELTRQESGCIVFEVTQDSGNINKFNVYEEFTDKASFTKHQERAGNSKWAVVTKNVERHYSVTGMD